jgi:hypothetical protein
MSVRASSILTDIFNVFLSPSTQIPGEYLDYTSTTIASFQMHYSSVTISFDATNSLAASLNKRRDAGSVQECVVVVSLRIQEIYIKVRGCFQKLLTTDTASSYRVLRNLRIRCIFLHDYCNYFISIQIFRNSGSLTGQDTGFLTGHSPFDTRHVCLCARFSVCPH